MVPCMTHRLVEASYQAPYCLKHSSRIEARFDLAVFFLAVLFLAASAGEMTTQKTNAAIAAIQYVLFMDLPHDQCGMSIRYVVWFSQGWHP